MTNKKDEISLPTNLVEALLVAVAGGDRNAINSVSADIKRLAEDQKPEKFPTHRK